MSSQFPTPPSLAFGSVLWVLCDTKAEALHIRYISLLKENTYAYITYHCHNIQYEDTQH